MSGHEVWDVPSAGAILLGAKFAYSSSCWYHGNRGDFKGRMDDFAIFDTVLDSGAIDLISNGAANNAAMSTIIRTVGGCLP